MSAMVLDTLAQLQAVADGIDKLESRRKEAAVDKERVEAILAKTRAKLDEKLAEQHAADMERRKHEVRLKEEKDRQARMKGRSAEAKTGREYQAVLAETSALKQTITGLEESMLKGMEALETLGKEVEELRGSIAKIEADAADANKVYDAAVQETETEIAAGKAEEKELLAKLPGDIMGRYKLIRTRRGGTAVVEVRNEACTACFMRIPPQAYIEIVRKSLVMQCPNCHRLLIPPVGPIEPMNRQYEDDE